MDPDPGRCSVCGIPLRPSQAGADVCGSPSCRRVQRLRPPKPRGGDSEARKAEALRRAATDRIMIEEEQRLRAVIPEKVLRARLPANESTIAPLPEERRATFTVNLSAALDRAVDDPDRPVPEAPESPVDAGPLVRAACAACRGSCCGSGGDHAFLYPDHFRRYLRAQPQKSREAILAEYLSRLPSASVADSCVYHTESGCALPRELRSNLCNTFRCGDLSELLDAPSSPGVPVLAFCFRDRRTDLVRTAILDTEGNAVPVTGPRAKS